ncbi:MAG: hypothetical protein RBR67_03230 [Desulfobacterium sp.]|jgi:hypothetical protein|nr:hypothetical protein [Desulfobacterium sp.]
MTAALRLMAFEVEIQLHFAEVFKAVNLNCMEDQEMWGKSRGFFPEGEGS